MPSMLKQDQPVNVDGGRAGLRRRGVARPSTRATRSSGRGTRRIKGETIAIDDKSGDLDGDRVGATTPTHARAGRRQGQEEGARALDRAPPTDFKYEEAARRATYTGDAHMSGPQGDLTADTIELYLKPSGDELERAEAYDARDAARAEPQDDGRPHDLLRRRRALRRDRHAGDDRRRVRPRNDRAGR